MAAATVARPDAPRYDPKRRQYVDHNKKQFAEPKWRHQEYKQRLNFYVIPPTVDITLEEFEDWAINRLKVLTELESCQFRNRSPEETASHMTPILQTYMPLSQNSARNPSASNERRRDHYSHFILRLAFAGTEDLRRRFVRLETALFRLRLQQTDARERAEFVDGLDLEWTRVTDAERAELSAELAAITPPNILRSSASSSTADDDSNAFFKLPWTLVPDLVETRRAYLRRGTAYLPGRELPTLLATTFSRRLEAALVVAARALPRLDEDDRLSPLLNHLARNFMAPGSGWGTDNADGASDSILLDDGGHLTADAIDALAPHFPLCMRSLHASLRRDGHLKHYGRLQYTLFLKGLGLSLDECLLFWRPSFRLMTDDKFNKEYRYNVRHAYGDVGGDANRRGRGYTPFSCQKLLTEALPSAGQRHGCPYRTHNEDNLVALLEGFGVRDRATLQGVREDVRKQRYHIACNRVFESTHAADLKRVKEAGIWGARETDTISHPNEYFKRSWMVGRVGREAKDKAQDGAAGPRLEVKMEID